MTVGLRRATVDDAIRFYAWRLEDEARRFLPAFAAPLSFEDHLTWFISRVATMSWWVAEISDETKHIVHDGVLGQSFLRPVGCLRIDERQYVSVIVDAAWRGHGYGVQIVKLAQCADHDARDKYESVPYRELFARIHRLNTPSQKTFEQAGFVQFTNVDDVWIDYKKES